jgi:predicted nucleotidyltransferase
VNEAGLREVRPRIHLPMDAIADFCRRHHVVEFALFGSVLRDDFRPDSDVDVLVVFEQGAHPTLLTLGEMKFELEDLFGRRVDVLTRDAVEAMPNPYRRPEILRTARVIYAR